MDIYILTIERNAHRYKRLSKYLRENNIKHTIFFGVDSKSCNTNNLKKMKYNKLCPNSVTACALSHILLWDEIGKSESECAIVLEDDTFIDINSFKEYSDKIINYARNNYFTYIFYDTRITTKPNFVLSTGGYALNSHTARRLSEYFFLNKIKFHIDFELNIALHNLKINKYIFKNVCYQLDSNNSSMTVKHDTYYIDIFKNTYIYRILTTPVLMVSDIEIDSYFILCFLIFIILFTLVNNSISLILACVYIIYLILDITNHQRT